MAWHSANKSNDGLICLVCDSKAWKHIDMTWPNFVLDPRNIRLGLALDGVNPYVHLSTNHSTWPIYSWTTICRLGWLDKMIICDVSLVDTREGMCKKWKHRCVSTTIGWKITIAMERGKHIWCDKAKMQVLVEGHLHVEFTRLLCIWFIYKLQFTKGYLACLICGLEVDIRHSSHLEKKIYLRHWHYLARGHPYRRDHVPFNRQIKNMFAPPKVFVAKFLRRAEEHEAWLDRRSNASKDKEDPIHTHGAKKKNIFFSLPYW
jgi:hypothetical protein